MFLSFFVVISLIYFSNIGLAIALLRGVAIRAGWQLRDLWWKLWQTTWSLGLQLVNHLNKELKRVRFYKNSLSIMINRVIHGCVFIPIPAPITRLVSSFIHQILRFPWNWPPSCPQVYFKFGCWSLGILFSVPLMLWFEYWVFHTFTPPMYLDPLFFWVGGGQGANLVLLRSCSWQYCGGPCGILEVDLRSALYKAGTLFLVLLQQSQFSNLLDPCFPSITSFFLD